jgi:hypothetical protein
LKNLSGAPLWGMLLALPTNKILGWKPARDKRSSFLQKFVNYGQKSYITLALGYGCYTKREIMTFQVSLLQLRHPDLKTDLKIVVGNFSNTHPD